MWLTKIFYTFLCISLVSRWKSRGLFNPAIAFFMRCFTSSQKQKSRKGTVKAFDDFKNKQQNCMK